MKTVSLTVTGRVQGVYYRASARQQALRLNIKGFAKNQSDGSVRIVAQGDDAALEALVNWCWQGSDRAQVSAVLVEELMAADVYDDFGVA
ncbi:MAG: acylphosphatase [Methylococcales bacterium]|nr:acylphosphatase [Methylococcales bacterium]